MGVGRKQSTEFSWLWAHATDHLRCEEFKLSMGVKGSGREKNRTKRVVVVGYSVLSIQASVSVYSPEKSILGLPSDSVVYKRVLQGKTAGMQAEKPKKLRPG